MLIIWCVAGTVPSIPNHFISLHIYPSEIFTLFFLQIRGIRLAGVTYLFPKCRLVSRKAEFEADHLEADAMLAAMIVWKLCLWQHA